MKEKHLITTYKGVKIFYHPADAQLHGTNEKTGENFQSKYIWEMEREIDTPVWEEFSGEGYMVSGYFGREITEVQGVKQDRKSKVKVYIRGRSTGSNYDYGKEVSGDKEKIFPKNKKNEEIFEQMKVLEKRKKDTEREQVLLANRLSS